LITGLLVLLLDAAAVEQWLTGTPEEALALRRPANDDVLIVLAEEQLKAA
jgi:putative SOS response-associated peptidase YedK